MAQCQVGLGGRAVQLLGHCGEHRSGACRLGFGDDHVTGRTPVVLLGAAADLAGLGDMDQ
ncbi:hypothetical protein A6A29_40750 [Streptomyces sp. TSRI0281]|nr:hypothetical protein A6A29_40750 [Streptomyces sp. TSRI0281]